MQNISLEQLTCKESCNQKLWLVITNTENFTHIFNKYPNLLNSTMLYFRKNMSNEKAQEYQTQAMQYNIRSKIRSIFQIRSKIQFLMKFFSEIKKFQIEKDLSYFEALNLVNSLLFKIGHKHYDGQENCQVHKMFFDKFPFEVNSTSLIPGEPNDFNLFVSKVTNQNKINLVQGHFC